MKSIVINDKTWEKLMQLKIKEKATFDNIINKLIDACGKS